MRRVDKEIDEETVGLICSQAPPSFQGSAGLARSTVSVLIIMELVCGCVGPRGSVTLRNRSLGSILLATLSACGKTKDLCSTVTYQITAKLMASHSKHTEDETPYHQERSRKEWNEKEKKGENKGKWFPKTFGRNTKSDNVGT